MPDITADPGFQRDIYSVSRLNSEVRAVLESSFPLIWVNGEISNLAQPASGHIYFSLKDAQAQVRCAMFRMKRQRLRFLPENGLKVLIRARVGLYEGRGEFQLMVEHMEPAGEGDLRMAFEALKLQLQSEGLFDTASKRALPLLPHRIGIITSPTGAAVRDVLTVLRRRFPAVPVLIYPVSVQGEAAAQSLVNALQLAERRQDCDLLILTRGGGSLEDLMAFNDEQVARAIHRLSIPLISAVGHEVDFTIADFVADRRAPTPSVAAELATPDKKDMLERIESLKRRASLCLQRQLQQHRQSSRHLSQRLQSCHPINRIRQQQQTVDTLAQQLQRQVKSITRHYRARCDLLGSRLKAATPAHRLQQQSESFLAISRRIKQVMDSRLQRQGQRVAFAAGRLNTLSPLATLQRGYSITRFADQDKLIHSIADVQAGDSLETQLADGRIVSTVKLVTKE